MLHESLITPKSNLTTVTENTTIAQVNDLFNSPSESHTRTMPILDESGNLFRGNVYKQHVYEHIAKNGDMNLPVTTIMRNSTKFIYTTSQFYEVFFAIRDLPFIAVLDDNHHFTGIFTHDALMDLLSQSWSVRTGGVALSVATHKAQGDLKKISTIIAKYSNIESVLSLQPSNGTITLMFTLPLVFDSITLQKLVKHLEKRHFEVISIENLQRFN
ncbi:cyclic di-AMP binding protein CbpA [Leuconostoc gasicomitatum]|uniref:cyclic di-AMP binding protein CbpA n=1 Tax=Leuconostoc gasicomitatum TaxID=115778 RepID=UPI001CC81EE5|nr:cyclic di-AMP binding protein CbpA [Leuconostoc gasicomitatum]MBZ5969043.1 CBS domain-containing protein [Leuconostoc gasicomitatum]MBZ5998473.1 CBS domain-containing protein [Leuconostoc gasicomitatum]